MAKQKKAKKSELTNGVSKKENHKAKVDEKLKKKLKQVLNSSKDTINIRQPIPSRPKPKPEQKQVPISTNNSKPPSNGKAVKKSGATEAKSTAPKAKAARTVKPSPKVKNEFVERKPKATSNDAPKKSRKSKQNQGFIEESVDVSKPKAKKAKCKGSGFIETNANNEEETTAVNRILQMQRQRFIEAMGMDPTIPMEKFSQYADEEVPGPSIVVHQVSNDKLSATKHASSASDSDDDSYINQFFDGNAQNNEFDSNDALTPSEIEKLSEHNGFLSSGSDQDESSSGSDATIVDSSSSFEVVDDGPSTSKQSKSTDHKKQLVHYNGDGDGSRDSYEEDSDEYYMDADSDQYDFGDYFDPKDGEYISDDEDYGGAFGGKFAGSSDYDSSSSEEEEAEEEESHSSNSSDYDDETDDREHYSSDEFYGHSDENEDESTYDEFMSGRYNDDSNDTDFYDSDYDDLVIAQGTAISYKLSDSRITLFENDTKTQIMELPKSDTEDENCAELVSLNVTKEEILISERHKQQTKKMHDDVVALKAKQSETEYEQKCESYFKMDESSATPTSVAEAPIEVMSPVVITCLPGSLVQMPILMDESTSGTDSAQLNLEVDSAVMNQSVVTSAPLNIPLAFSMDTDDVHEDEATSDRDNVPSPPVENDFVEFCQSERIKNRNTSLTKSQVAKTKPKFFNSINSQHVLLLLRNILHFHGNLQVKLIEGKAEVFGYQLERNKTVTVHSPRGHSLIYLVPSSPKRKSINNTTTFAALNELKADFLAQDIDELIAEFNQSTDAIILLERDTTNKGVNMIDRYMRETMFPNINAFNNESPYYSSEFILHCQFSFRPRNSLVINEAWSTVPLKSASKLATIGGKGVGKSTFVRHAINSNMNKFKKFVFIDLDIGQPELFVPQTISATLLTNPILGPGYLENIPPTKAIFFGEINVLPNPIKYLKCVIELYEFCSKCETFQNVPWIINTMGYSRGLGAELMACILRIFKPTDVVQIESQTANQNFEAIINAEYVNAFKFNILAEEVSEIDATCNFRTHTFTAITGNDSRQTDMTPKDIRYAMILSKLGNCLRCNSDWLTSIRPFEASLNDLQIIVANGDKIEPTSVADVLNGNLVYLCESKAGYSNDIVDCHGIGIVRAIDPSTEKLYLLSSIPMEELAKVNVLAIGAIPLPSAVLLNQHGQVRGTVPFVYNSDGFVGSKQVAQHIFRSEKNRKNNPIQLMEN